jgi:hypothetical protein
LIPGEFVPVNGPTCGPGPIGAAAHWRMGPFKPESIWAGVHVGLTHWGLGHVGPGQFESQPHVGVSSFGSGLDLCGPVRIWGLGLLGHRPI